MSKYAISRLTDNNSYDKRDYIRNDSGEILLFNTYVDAAYILMCWEYDRMDMEREGIKIVKYNGRDK